MGCRPHAHPAIFCIAPFTGYTYVQWPQFQAQSLPPCRFGTSFIMMWSVSAVIHGRLLIYTTNMDRLFGSILSRQVLKRSPQSWIHIRFLNKNGILRISSRSTLTIQTSTTSFTLLEASVRRNSGRGPWVPPAIGPFGSCILPEWNKTEERRSEWLMSQLL